MRNLLLLRGLVFSLLLSGGSTAFAEESLILNRKGKFSIPYNHQYLQASIDAIHNGEFDIRSINRGDYTSVCLLYTSPSPRDKRQSRMPSSA